MAIKISVLEKNVHNVLDKISRLRNVLGPQTTLSTGNIKSVINTNILQFNP